MESELLKLIADYNSLRNSYLFVYAAAIGKPIPTVPLEQSDFYMFRDLLSVKETGIKLMCIWKRQVVVVKLQKK